MPQPTIETRPCAVHVLIDNDSTPRECRFCVKCDAWICFDDMGDMIRRGKAFFKQVTNSACADCPDKIADRKNDQIRKRP